jgi:hypothetical protein
LDFKVRAYKFDVASCAALNALISKVSCAQLRAAALGTGDHERTSSAYKSEEDGHSTEASTTMTYTAPSGASVYVPDQRVPDTECGYT